jgi:hypothetical protein
MKKTEKRLTKNTQEAGAKHGFLGRKRLEKRNKQY